MTQDNYSRPTKQKDVLQSSQQISNKIEARSGKKVKGECRLKKVRLCLYSQTVCGVFSIDIETLQSTLIRFG